MQVIIEVYNTYSHLHGHSDAIKTASNKISYPAPGAEYILRNVRYGWDGMIRLMKANGQFPTGLIRDVVSALKDDYQIKVVDKRIRPEKKYNLKINLPFAPRYYQTDSTDLTAKHNRGVYILGTGAGKSVIIAMIAQRVGVDTLIVVPDLGLKEQLYKSMKSWMGNAVSTNINSSAPIIIANIDGVTRKDKSVFLRFGMLITDEQHHSSAKTYLKLNMMMTNAYYRYGLTGTFTRTDGSEMTMYGVLSNIIYKKSTSDLITEGFLSPVKIYMHQIRIKGHSQKKYKEAYPLFCLHEDVNKIIEYLARKEISLGKQVLILVRLKHHGEMLKMMLRESAIYLNGDDPISYREEQKSLFLKGSVRCLIATSVLGEGQDIPNIDVLINARMQKSEILTYQGIGRALRLKEGKKYAVVHDFIIQGNRYIYDHSLERLAQYKSEKAFQVILK